MKTRLKSLLLGLVLLVSLFTMTGCNTEDTQQDVSSTVPTEPISPSWTKVAAGTAHTMVIKSDGTLWGLGDNTSGQLGDGTTTNSFTLVQESTHATNWISVSAGGFHTVAIKSDGTLWAWGANYAGQLGDGTLIDRLTPVQESSHTTIWSMVNAGSGGHTVALRSDGTLWSWGNNIYGQLCDGTTLNSSNPTQESTNASNWSSVDAGGYFTVALKTDGTLWSWGDNIYGQLGDGTQIDRNTPIREDSWSSNWISVYAGRYFTVALKSDGTLWAWGDNSSAQLGDGSYTDKWIPTQEVTAATDWSSISAGDYFTVALKTDGTLWSWGDNIYGQLGDGTTSGSNTPIQESTLATNWVGIIVGNAYTLALQGDDTIWAWGFNSAGQLGDGTTTNLSTPTLLQ